MKKITVEYFALLSVEAGKEKEVVETTSTTLGDLFQLVNERYQFSLSKEQIKASINNSLTLSWDERISDGDEILFLTPLAGG